MRTYFIRVPQYLRKVYPRAIWDCSSWSKEHKVLLTIDDGPHPQSTPAWLDWLANHNVKAIFFLTGRLAIEHEDLVASIKSEGHYVGSHGFNHLDGWKTSSKVYNDDALHSLELLDTTLFRPPYGRMTYHQYRRIRNYCDIMMWSVMPGDFDSKLTQRELKKRLVKVKHHDIIVLHDEPAAFDRINKSLSDLLIQI